MSQAKISRIETGAVTADPADVRAIVRVLAVPAEEAERLVDRAERAQNTMMDWRPGQLEIADRQREVARIEAVTAEFRVFQPAVVVGLAQTSEYARAILTRYQADLAATGSGAALGAVSDAVAARVRRHLVLANSTKRFHFVMTESVLSNRVCRPAEMLGQIERLRDIAGQDNIALKLIPADTELTIPPYHGFELLDDRHVMVDLFNTTLTSGGRTDAALYRRVFDSLDARATADIDELLGKYTDHYLELSRSQRALGA
jgi:hypothetical protein